MGERDTGSLRVLVVQHEDVVPVRMLGGWLAEEGAEVLTVRPDRGERLPSGDEVQAYDAAVVLGGTMDSWDDAHHPWFPATRSLLRAAADRGVPVLAICLGHQLGAQAFGGEVGRNPAGQTAAVVPVGWTDAAYADPLLGAIARETRGAAVAVHHNSDVVTRLPDGAEVLATAPDGSPQATRLAGSVWGVQCHPEADAGLVRAWEGLRADGPRAEVVADAEHAMPSLLATWRLLGRSLVALADARRAGGAASTAAADQAREVRA